MKKERADQLTLIRQKAASFQAGCVPRRYRCLLKHGFASGVPGYNHEMRWACGLVVSLLVSAVLSAQQTHAPLLPCPEGASQSQCNPSKKEMKQARASFSRGLKLQEKAPDEAYEQFKQAADLVPRNVEYMTAREVARQQLVYNPTQRGNSAL